MATKRSSATRTKTKTAAAEAPSKRKRATSPELAVATFPAAAPTHDQIAARAYALFLARGATHGAHEDDWARAERELAGR